jgi:acyl carrier protein
MASGLPRIALTALSLDALAAQAERLAKKSDARTDAFERPELDSDFVAPRTAIEEKLAEFWRKLLGVAQVGVDDNFFDLGGHSLIAVRLFTMIKREYSVEFPISVLFEAPTIARCAALIAEERGEGGLTDPKADRPLKTGSDTARETRKVFTHVVPLSRNETTTGKPMFIVAGMFGNVLNLRHVALELGRDRPVYGLQARGLIGDMEPHTRIEDAASDCIAEMRQVQPEGPYFVAGFSGGGITGSYIEGEDGVPHTTAFRFPTVLSEFENAARTGVITRMLENHVVALPTPDHACKIDWTPGASFMMRRKMIDEVGSFDEGYFLYFEETDLCLRAQRQGWETHFVPESRIMHIGSVSTGMREWARTPTYWFDSRQRYFTKNHGRTAFWAANLARLGGGLLWRLRVLLSNRPLGEAPFFLSDLIWHAVTPRKDRMS